MTTHAVMMRVLASEETVRFFSDAFDYLAARHDSLDLISVRIINNLKKALRIVFPFLHVTDDVLPWDCLFQQSLPPGVRGIVVVLDPERAEDGTMICRRGMVVLIRNARITFRMVRFARGMTYARPVAARDELVRTLACDAAAAA